MVHKFIIGIMNFIFIFQGTAWGEGLPSNCSPVKGKIFYRVRRGDGLGNIIRSLGLKPIWNKENGYVNRISKKNHIKDPDLIYIKSLLQIPFRCEEDLSRYKLVKTDKGRVIDWRSFVSRKISSEQDFSQQLNEKPDLEHSETNQGIKDLVDNSPKFNSYSKFYISTNYNFYRIQSVSSSNNSSAVLVSDPSLGLDINWKQVWSGKFSTEVNLSYSNIKLQTISENTLQNANQNIGEVGIGLGYALNPVFQTKVNFLYGKELYSRSVSQGVATLDAIDGTQGRISLVSKLQTYNTFLIDIETGYIHDFQASANTYNINNGSGYFVLPRIRQKSKKFQLELSLIYSENTLSSSISEQKNTQFGVQFGIMFEVGK